MPGKVLLLVGCFYNCCKSFWLVYGELAQDLAVKSDVSLLEAGNQLAVSGTVFACACVDAGVPQFTESALAVAAVAIRELQSLSYGLLTALDARAVRAGHALSGLTDLLVLAVASNASFYAHLLRLLAAA